MPAIQLQGQAHHCVGRQLRILIMVTMSYVWPNPPDLHHHTPIMFQLQLNFEMI